MVVEQYCTVRGIATGQDCSSYTNSKVAVLAQMPRVTVMTFILSAWNVSKRDIT